ADTALPMRSKQSVSFRVHSQARAGHPADLLAGGPDDLEDKCRIRAQLPLDNLFGDGEAQVVHLALERAGELVRVFEGIAGESHQLQKRDFLLLARGADAAGVAALETFSPGRRFDGVRIDCFLECLVTAGAWLLES